MTNSFENGIELWELIRRGDRAAFDAVYHQYVSQLFVLAYKHIPNRTDAEDIVQEVFLDIWEKEMRSSFTPPSLIIYTVLPATKYSGSSRLAAPVRKALIYSRNCSINIHVPKNTVMPGSVHKQLCDHGY